MPWMAEEKNMTNGLQARISATLLLALVISVVPVVAKPTHFTAHLSKPTKVGSTQLLPGTYKFVLDGGEVTVMSGSEMVARVPGHTEDRTQAAEDILVKGAQGELLEVREKGQARVLVLDSVGSQETRKQ